MDKLKSLFERDSYMNTGKGEKLFALTITTLLFVITSFKLWQIIYMICNMLGSIVEEDPAQCVYELKRVLPNLISGFAMLYIGTYYFDSLRAKTYSKRGNILKINGIITLAVGIFVIVYIGVGMADGQYESLTKAVKPDRDFLLENIAYGAAFVIFGLICFADGKKKSAKEGECAYCTGVRGFIRVLHFLSYGVACASFASLVYSTFVMDFTHGYLFFNVMMLLNLFAAFAMAVFYRFGYCEIKREYRKDYSLKMGLIFLAVNIVLFALYSLAVQIQNEAPDATAFGLLPIDFTASFNAFPFVYGLNNLLAPIIAVLYGLFRRRKAK